MFDWFNPKKRIGSKTRDAATYLRDAVQQIRAELPQKRSFNATVTALIDRQRLRIRRAPWKLLDFANTIGTSWNRVSTRSRLSPAHPSPVTPEMERTAKTIAEKLHAAKDRFNALQGTLVSQIKLLERKGGDLRPLLEDEEHTCAGIIALADELERLAATWDSAAR